MDAVRASTEMIQPIALHREGTHEDAIAATTLASVLAYVNTIEDPSWQQWLSGRFGKSVRRARNAQFVALAPDAAATAVVGSASAAGFRPTIYDDMDVRLRKLQVAGTDLPRTGEWITATTGPTLTVNDDLGMSTGKSAAQVAHALFSFALRIPREDLLEWAAAGAPFTITPATKAQFNALMGTARVRINDAGLTEIAPGSATVLAHF